MVVLKGIQETRSRMSYRGVHQFVNSKNGEGVFWAGFVQVRKIHAHLPLSIFLFNHHCVSQPLGVRDFFDSPNLL